METNFLEKDKKNNQTVDMGPWAFMKESYFFLFMKE